MTALLFALVILLALTSLLWRKYQKTQNERLWNRQPGHSIETALKVSRFADIDTYLNSQRCHCGARMTTISEGSRNLGTTRIRVTRTECNRCEAELDFFFIINESSANNRSTLN